MTRDYVELPIEPPDDYYDDSQWSDECEDEDFETDPLAWDDIEGRRWRREKRRELKERYPWLGMEVIDGIVF